MQDMEFKRKQSIANTENGTQILKNVPDSYLKIVIPFIDSARLHMESGGSFPPCALVVRFSSTDASYVIMDVDSKTGKFHSTQVIRDMANKINAEFILLIMTSKALQEDKQHMRDEIVKKFRFNFRIAICNIDYGNIFRNISRHLGNNFANSY